MLDQLFFLALRNLRSIILLLYVQSYKAQDFISSNFYFLFALAAFLAAFSALYNAMESYTAF